MMTSRNYRKKAFEQYEKVCKSCGTDTDIVVHHVDGDRRNNDINNLMPLCERCHKSVHTTYAAPRNEFVSELRDKVSRQKGIKTIKVMVDKNTHEKLKEVKGERSWKKAVINEFGVGADE